MFDNWPNEHALITDPMMAYYILAVIIFWPIFKIFKRAGLSPLPAVSLAVPYVGLIIAASFLCFQKWPSLTQGDQT